MSHGGEPVEVVEGWLSEIVVYDDGTEEVRPVEEIREFNEAKADLVTAIRESHIGTVVNHRLFPLGFAIYLGSAGVVAAFEATTWGQGFLGVSLFVLAIYMVALFYLPKTTTG